MMISLILAEFYIEVVFGNSDYIRMSERKENIAVPQSP